MPVIFPLYSSKDGVCTCSEGVKCGTAGKHPMVRWKEYEGDDEGEYCKGPGGDYGVPTGSRNGFFVVDLDVKPAKGIDGLEALAALGELPDTLTVATPSGGWHLYFKMPRAQPVGGQTSAAQTIHNSVSKLAPGVDIRGEGGFVVGPGSHHKNGGVYTVQQDLPGEPVEAPAWLLEALARIDGPSAKPSAEASHGAGGARPRVDPSSAEGVRRIEKVRERFRKELPSIEGQDGSTKLMGVARRAVRSELPLDTLEELLLEEYNPRCEPPWSPREIRHKLEDADRIDVEPRGVAPDGLMDKLKGWVTPKASADPSDPVYTRSQPNAEHRYTFTPGDVADLELEPVSIAALMADLTRHVEWEGVLRFDEFKDQILAVNPPMKLDAETKGLSDNDVEIIRAWFEQHGKKARTADVWAATRAVAVVKKYHAVRDYLEGLQWDGVGRLTTVLPNYFETKDSAYERAIGVRWFVAAIARAMEPGCQSDSTMLLQGLQGYYKNRALRALSPVIGWYCETSVAIGSKDFYEQLRGIWIYCFDELDSLHRGDLTKVKSVLTSTYDRFRPSYGRSSATYPRQVCFCGTTNKDIFLEDETGNRRFWPVKVLRMIDASRIERDRDLLWAEALVRYKAGEKWYLDTRELRALSEAEQEERMQVEPWDDLVASWLNDPEKVSHTPVAKAGSAAQSAFGGLPIYDASKGVKVVDVLRLAVGKDSEKMNRGDENRMAAVLKRVGWGSMTRTLENGIRVRRYSRTA